jgi:hypothetical protein
MTVGETFVDANGNNQWDDAIPEVLDDPATPILTNHLQQFLLKHLLMPEIINMMLLSLIPIQIIMEFGMML